MFLGDAPLGAKEAFADDLTLAMDEVQQGVNDKCSKAAIKHWSIWEMFCGKLAINPWLFHCTNPTPILQVFMHRVKDSQLTSSSKPVSA
jgi:hypothetical protein